MRKTFLTLLSIIVLFFLSSCKDDEIKDYPKNEKEYINLKLENGYFSFDESKVGKKAKCIFSSDNKEYTIEIENNTHINNLDLPLGSYNIKVLKDEKGSLYDDNIDVLKEKTFLKAPTNLSINDNYIFFAERRNDTGYVVKFEDIMSSKKIERIVTNAQNIDELLIPKGEYNVSIMAKGDNVYLDSMYSEAIKYTKKEDTKVIINNKSLINDGFIKWYGRCFYNDETNLNEVYHTGGGFEVNYIGTKLSVVVHATNYDVSYWKPYIVVVVDDDFDNATTYDLTKEVTTIVLDEREEESGLTITPHKVCLYKRSESLDSYIAIEEVSCDGVILQNSFEEKHKIEFISDSGATGYGNMANVEKTSGTSDGLNAYAFLTARNLDCDASIFAASGWGLYASQWTEPHTINVSDSYKYVNFRSDIVWNSAKFVPDVIVINLGTNDWSYIYAGVESAEIEKRTYEFKKKYEEFVLSLHTLYPDAKIVALYGLMNEKDIYESIETVINNLMRDNDYLSLIKINGDGKAWSNHPTIESNKEISIKLSQYIKELMGW